MHLSHKPPSYWRILFQSGGYPRQFIRMKKFRDLVVPSRDWRKGIFLQGRQLPSGLPVIDQSFLRIKGGVTGASVNATRQRNSTYAQAIRRSIYNTRRPERPHLPIRRYEQRPQGPLHGSVTGKGNYQNKKQAVQLTPPIRQVGVEKRVITGRETLRRGCKQKIKE